MDKRPVPDTKDRLLRAGEQLFRTQGYAGTGLKQLTQAAEAPWGSLYHFFPGGKEQLGEEVLAYAARLYAEGWKQLFLESSDPVAAVRRAFDIEVRVLERSDYRNGCPVASVTLDVASTVPSLRVSCAAAFQTWIDAIARGLSAAGLTADRANTLAVFSLAAMEGAIVLSRASKTTEPLRQTASVVELALRAALQEDRKAGGAGPPAP